MREVKCQQSGQQRLDSFSGRKMFEIFVGPRTFNHACLSLLYGDTLNTMGLFSLYSLCSCRKVEGGDRTVIAKKHFVRIQTFNIAKVWGNRIENLTHISNIKAHSANFRLF